MRSIAARGRDAHTRSSHFVLYVEGPRDQDILRAWARRLSRPLARSLEQCAVILGGRQPVRAVEHFRKLGGVARGARALCVLDRDGDSNNPDALPREPGLEFFTWPRRHIESYLLVPEAIRRSLRLSKQDSRVDRFFREHVPGVGEEQAFREFDAKGLLALRGPLARGLGRSLPSGRIASAMREGEIHADVLELFERLRSALHPGDSTSPRVQH